jgi:GT2 family glycosyltransferase
MLEFVAASRGSAAAFRETLLGRSLRRLAGDERIGARIVVNNTQGLSEVYNRAIEQSEAEALVFIHDDVQIDSRDVVDRVVEGLGRFDVLGICGNTYDYPEHLQWSQAPDASHLSGALTTGDPLRYGSFGSAPAECALLDGLFLAARTSTLRRTGLRFDPRFRFDFYDLDFCRTARQLGLRLGTWPIDVVHPSSGGYTSERWREAGVLYQAKWAEAIRGGRGGSSQP